jgi:hypothetical protein
VATAAEFVPYLLFGLVIGAWPEAPLKVPDWRRTGWNANG